MVKRGTFIFHLKKEDVCDIIKERAKINNSKGKWLCLSSAQGAVTS